MTQLGVEIDRYRRLPAQERRGFHRFLEVEYLGAKGAQQILDAYAAWENRKAQPRR